MSLTHPDIDSGALLSVVEHVFLPSKLPQEAQTGKADRGTNVALCHILLQVAATFHQYLLPSQEFVWTRIEKMIKSQRTAMASPIERERGSAFSDLGDGDVFVMHIREKNAAVVIRVFKDCVRFEMFEVSPPASAVMSTNGKLLCSYPGPAVEVSPEIFGSRVFLGELASFLIQMDIDVLDSTATTVKAGSTRFGQPASVDRITKRIGDEVLWKGASKPWRRSPLWLVIRVALQTSLDCNIYKTYVLFVHAHLLKICAQKDFPSETLHLMRIKMTRRLSKLGLADSDDIYQVVHDVAQQTEELLQNRWSSFQTKCSTSPPWHRDGLDFVGDSTLTLKNSRHYLTSALSSTSRHTALADFELSVERDLDPWVESIRHNDDAPDVIASCVEQYFASAREIYGADPEENSIMIMDLWKALDTLTIRQCPLLRSYSPEIHRDFLHPLLLHRSGSLRRAELIEMYIFQRHEEASYATSIFSDKPIDSSFAVQYFHSSPRLQRLYTDINQQARRECNTLAMLGEDGTVKNDKKTSVVFELSPPSAFFAWREITYKILCDITVIGKSSVHDGIGQPKLLLNTFSGLKQWAVCHTYYRITIASTTKSFSDQTHYKSVRIPTDDSVVLLNNGLSFNLFDRTNESWESGPFASSIANTCASPTPMTPYSKIHSFVSGVHHTSNQRATFAMVEHSKGAAVALALISSRRGTHADYTSSMASWPVVGRFLLTSRLLSSARDPDICEKACTLLQKARSVTHRWIGGLGSKPAATDDEMSYTDLHRLLCVLAETRFSTYNVCPEQVLWMLFSDSDFAIAVHCTVTVRDNTPSTLEGDDSGYLTRLLNRHLTFLSRISTSAYSRTHQASIKDSQVYGRDSVDRPLRIGAYFLVLTHDGYLVWISCIEKSGQEVHLNFLTGQLLIKGNPLGRLPQEITGHSTYVGVLGTRILDVIPANIPGMEFMTRSNVSGYRIYFSLRDGDLTLQARRPGDPRLLQLVPRAVLVGDFPKAFVDDYVHWLDLRTGEVEFRPVKYPWTSHPSNWRLHIHTDDTRSMSRKIPGDGTAPNLELECRSIPGYVIDKLQSCGTMFGLKNRLVLCPSNRSSEMLRRVVIPQGEIVFSLSGNFSQVSIETGTARRVIWHEYTIDTDLGRLSGVVNLRSKLYQCYLHALTSHCLLGHTGTEESLHMFQSAAFLSFQRLDVGDAKLLDLISNMTPPRVYYPPHLQSMVTVEWKSLPVLSQHHNFYPAVLSVLGHAHAMEALYGKPVDFQVSPQDSFLLKRATSRTQVYYPHDLQNSRHPSSSIPEDVAYESRDIVDERSPERAAYQMSWSVWNDRPCFFRKCTELCDAMKSWKSVGPAKKDISLRYSRYWLTFNAAEDWLGIYDICQEALNCDPQESKIRLAFSLSAASFSGIDYADIIPLVQICATDPKPHYELSDDTGPDHTRLETLMFQFVLPLQRTPAQTMEVPTIASKKAAWKERERQSNRTISENVSTGAQSTMDMWPKICARSPTAVTSPSLRAVLMSRANLPRPSVESNPPLSRKGLGYLIQEFRNSQGSLLQLYGDDLQQSYSDLLEKSASFPSRGIPPQEALRHYRDVCSRQKDALFSDISGALAPARKVENVLSVSGLWPRITPRSILRELSRDRIHAVADRWKDAIIRYAIVFLKYQQSQRLVELSSGNRDEEFLREAETACEEVVAACSPDWLLIQRSAPPQLNMGEGKSSVIVPLVAATIADGSHLARIVTLKPLSNQTATRPTFCISAPYKQCVDEGGILVVQTGHILSQKLMCITLLTSSEAVITRRQGTQCPTRLASQSIVFSRLQEHAEELQDCFPQMFELDRAEKGFPKITTLWKGILLLRGLLVDGDGILGYVLMERRWRVDYGLDPKRTLLAVPFLAKDVPSLRAKFGHPDVAIALTCLSYYYGDLTKEQLLQCFDILIKLDNPDMEYDQWVESGKNIPYSLQQINGVNTKDDNQINKHLVPLFSKNIKVIDLYLSQVVFPRAAKEFTHKLSTSAWDLVKDKSNLTTGFSGTNDNRYLLPTSITQEDPVSQLSTNALVLEYILQPENNHHECTESNDGECESAGAFLQRLTSHVPEVRVLLDVGAQMLELENEELARDWLSLKRHEMQLSFSTNPIISLCAPRMEQLSHSPPLPLIGSSTRTDLKLPRGTRAGVTLGPKVTKAATRCMRMRQLGKGQSVIFFAPGEVGFKNAIGAIDILRWAMYETCEDISHRLPQGAQQGVDHHRRFSAYEQYRSTGDLRDLKSAWSRRESRTLEEMYEPVSNAQGAGLYWEINNIPSLRERLNRLGVTQLTDSNMIEEQEREFYLQRISSTTTFLTFVRTGKLPEQSTHIIPLFAPTGIDKALDSTIEWSPSPLATADFATTTEYSSGNPYKGNELLPVIRKSDKSRRRVRGEPPAYIRTELNLFAGQLYLDSKEEYDRHIEVDEFVRPPHRTGAKLPFSVSVISTFKELTGFRRKGMGYNRTHLGRVLDARSLSSEFGS
ncbi:hypothetical protein EDB87DRAFT_1582498 [Lactarius vividus]|nr:hypothetical protein EDB87DRAFT_1582498 [Lactarius vividus]